MFRAIRGWLRLSRPNSVLMATGIGLGFTATPAFCIEKHNSPAAEFVRLWRTGSTDLEAQEKLASICAERPLYGRVVCGESERDFFRLSRSFPVVFIFGPDALMRFLGKGGREILLDVLGWNKQSLDKSLERGVQFKLVIFQTDSSMICVPATWDGIGEVARKAFPEVAAKILARLPEIKHTPFDELDNRAQSEGLRGVKMRMSEIELRQIPEGMVRVPELKELPGTAVEVRMFLWNTIGANSLFSGDGFTKIEADGTVGVREYLVLNDRPLSEIEGCLIIDLAIDR